MAQQHIYTDTDQLVLLLKARQIGRKSHMINASDVQRISFVNYMHPKFMGLIEKPARKIQIMAKGIGMTEFLEPEEKEFFETYLVELRKFCKDNRVTFYDFPEE